MPLNLIAFLMEIGLKEIVAALGLLAALATAGGYIYYNFRLQKNKIRDDATKEKADAAKEWRDVADAHAVRISLLDLQLQTANSAHAACEEQINKLTQFNLQLQSRERGYQRGINKLEIRLGLEPTDWNDITHAPRFDS